MLVVFTLLACAASASSQTGQRQPGKAASTPAAYVHALNAQWALPRAREFAAVATVLARVTADHCANEPDSPPDDVRAAWRGALIAWAHLGTVAIGPLIDRRSARRIDFQPLRPALLERAIAAQPVGADAMDAIGGPAKGFPALEALLWPKAPPPGSPTCAYAVQVADDIAREAQALAGDFAAAARNEPDDAEAATAFGEAVNQWLGGLEALRLQGYARPLREPRGAAPRAASGAAADERTARWRALESLAVSGGADAPAPDAGLVTIETTLRAKGLNPLANRLVAAMRQAGRAIVAANGDAPARRRAAAAALGRLKTLVETAVAPALGVRPAFSDADGD